MPIVSHRRAFLAGLTALLAPLPARAANAVAADRLKSASERIAALETRAGGRLGVFVLDTGSGLSIGHRSDERFPMCSTFKLLTAAAVLARVDAGGEQLDRKIPYGPADLVDGAPVTKAHVGDGAMSIGDLCAAAIDWSDNTAANLLLTVLGGPAAFTRYVRSLGDELTRLDRNEPTLNTAIAGDERDTTTPSAMVRDMQAVLIGDKLSDASRRQLETWLIGDKVGDKRIRAGLPPSWRVGDKTGTGDHGSTNDIGILWPPNAKPLLVCAYLTGSTASLDQRNATIAAVGRAISASFHP
jgi:beta-lactamase class A